MCVQGAQQHLPPFRPVLLLRDGPCLQQVPMAQGLPFSLYRHFRHIQDGFLITGSVLEEASLGAQR